MLKEKEWQNKKNNDVPQKKETHCFKTMPTLKKINGIVKVICDS